VQPKNTEDTIALEKNIDMRGTTKAENPKMIGEKMVFKVQL